MERSGRYKRFVKAGYRIAVDLDLAKFFDDVQHDVLMARVARKVGDKRVLAPDRALPAGGCHGRGDLPAHGDGNAARRSALAAARQHPVGRPGQGTGTTGPALRSLRRRSPHPGQEPRAGERVKASVTRYLTRRLKLSVNEQKSQVAPIDQCVFLGFTFRGSKLRWSDEAFADFQHRLRRLTGRSWGVSMELPARSKLAQYLRGWMDYFGISQYYRPIPELDHWLRRRVRMCYWKQWRCRAPRSAT